MNAQNFIHTVHVDSAKTVFCLEILWAKLKPKGVKHAVGTRFHAIFCFADVSYLHVQRYMNHYRMCTFHVQSIDSGLAKSKDNNDPYILAIGENADKIKSMVIVSGKVIIDKLGSCPLVGLMALLSMCITFISGSLIPLLKKFWNLSRRSY